MRLLLDKDLPRQLTPLPHYPRDISHARVTLSSASSASGSVSSAETTASSTTRGSVSSNLLGEELRDQSPLLAPWP